MDELKSKCHGATVIWVRNEERYKDTCLIKVIPIYKCFFCHKECETEEKPIEQEA